MSSPFEKSVGGKLLASASTTAGQDTTRSE